MQTTVQVLAAIGFGLALALLAGCAAGPAFTGICALKPIGQQDGATYVMAYCEARE